MSSRKDNLIQNRKSTGNQEGGRYNKLLQAWDKEVKRVNRGLLEGGRQ